MRQQPRYRCTHCNRVNDLDTTPPAPPQLLVRGMFRPTHATTATRTLVRTCEFCGKENKIEVSPER